MASRKRMKIKHRRSKRRYLNEIRQLGQKLSQVQEDISKLITPKKPKKVEVKNECH